MDQQAAKKQCLKVWSHARTLRNHTRWIRRCEHWYLKTEKIFRQLKSDSKVNFSVLIVWFKCDLKFHLDGWSSSNSYEPWYLQIYLHACASRFFDWRSQHTWPKPSPSYITPKYHTKEHHCLESKSVQEQINLRTKNSQSKQQVKKK